MSIDKLTVTIWFEHDKRPTVVDELFSHMSSWEQSRDGYAVPFASWGDVSRRLGLLDSLAETVVEAIRFADKGKGPAEANIPAMDMADMEACLDELTPGWRQRGAQHNG